MTTASTTPALEPADPRSAFVPASPTPLCELIEALKRVGPLQGMEDSEYEWLAKHGEERLIPAGTTLFHEGDNADMMSIVLRGEIHVRRERGGPAALFIGRTGQITGLLPFSRMKTYGGHGYVVVDIWALDYPRSSFAEMMQAVPSMTQRCVSVLLDRVREVTRLEQQTEKLNALGKLAGNLAHEMNNPASAAQRAASGLLDELRVYGHEKFKLGSLCLDAAHLTQVRKWQDSIQELAKNTRADVAHSVGLEDNLQAWLKGRGVSETWRIAPELAELGVTAEQLNPLGEFLNADSLSIVLGQFASSVRAERIAEAMLDSTARIFDLIRAIKDYSYLDQAPIQEVDVRQGLENTLTMLQSRLANVEVERRYAEDLPLIAAYGSELNQVWTALLENALDAIQDRGKITLAVQVSGEMILIEVWDDGPGIPSEIKNRIFEPFFTTKAPGSGLGLGLDTVQRVVRRHSGYVSVTSEPGATCFQIRLPMEQLQAY
ncbi:signal transduction histidine kinase [Silvibacterium bohemicum]|uniref:histidine kinase n=1 Tax=Silvibacterium bohemicum TaxID=1577686 RepID=A0A841JNM2_9BACT|nr:ATP-binding protein [Silvibacterium bohemicum]MBB6142187.1 signal transduction histidine kinase [Silvibacterium bohemicum]